MKGIPPKRGTHSIPANKKRKGQASDQATQEPQIEHQEEVEDQTPPMPLEPLDRRRFQSRSKQQCFVEMETHALMCERKVKLELGEYEELQGEIRKRRWEKLAKPVEKVNEEIVKEFYANAWPLQRTSTTKISWVRGHRVPYDRNAINEFLGNPLTLAENALDTYNRLKKRGDFKDDEVARILCLPGHTYQTNHQGKAMRILRPSMKTIT